MLHPSTERYLLPHTSFNENMSSLDFTNSPSGQRTLSVWQLPGIDKETFYAAALYLHVAARGQLREPSRNTPRHQSQTDEGTKRFLDRVADCFARSKDVDPSAHVTATAMSTTRDTQGNKVLTVYITKNHSEKQLDTDPPRDHGRGDSLNQNVVFAKALFDWFNSMNRSATLSSASSSSSETSQDFRRSHLDGVWRTLCEFNRSRLVYYIERISGMSLGLLRTILADEPKAAWKCAETVIRACREYGIPGRYTDKGLLDADLARLEICARLAAECRSNILFSNLCRDAEGLVHSNGVNETTEKLVKFAKSINYLGRLGAACNTFYDYCTMAENHHATFEYVLLPSPDEVEWPAATYKSKIEHWTGELGLDDDRTERKPVRATLDQYVSGRAGQRGKARLHCEIQLLRYFSQPETPSCLDYIGCSKKSCWLCWQLMGHFGKFTTKESHYMLYPMWATPSDVLASDLGMARAISATYHDMLSLIQEKVLFNRDFSTRINITHTSERLSLRTLAMKANETSSSLQHRVTVSSQPQWAHPFQYIRVVHLPAAREQELLPAPRVIEMEMFESDPYDASMSRTFMKFTMLFIGETECIFACQIETRAEDKELSLHEYHQHFWFHDFVGNYLRIYRCDDIDLRPNPWMTDKFMKVHSDEVEDIIPWRGDVYLIPIRQTTSTLHATASLRDWPQWDPDPDRIRLDICLSELEKELSDTAAPANLAARMFSDLEESKRRLRMYSDLFEGQNALFDLHEILDQYSISYKALDKE